MFHSIYCSFIWNKLSCARRSGLSLEEVCGNDYFNAFNDSLIPIGGKPEGKNRGNVFAVTVNTFEGVLDCAE